MYTVQYCIWWCWWIHLCPYVVCDGHWTADRATTLLAIGSYIHHVTNWSPCDWSTYRWHTFLSYYYMRIGNPVVLYYNSIICSLYCPIADLSLTPPTDRVTH